MLKPTLIYIEEARGLAQLRAGRGYTVEQIAKKLGRGKE